MGRTILIYSSKIIYCLQHHLVVFIIKVINQAQDFSMKIELCNEELSTCFQKVVMLDIGFILHKQFQKLCVFI